MGPFTVYVTVEESGSDGLEITQHPVQRGAAITDHAFKKPASVTVKCVFGDADQSLEETYRQLLSLQSTREPFDVVTGKRSYSNMLLKDLDVTTDVLTERVLAVSAGLQEIILVDVQAVTVAARSNQANPGKTGANENAGKKAGETASEPRKRSALAALFSGGGEVRGAP